MFKKSDNQGDKSPKQENTGHTSKTAEAADQSAPKAEEKTAPAKEDKKS